MTPVNTLGEEVKNLGEQSAILTKSQMAEKAVRIATQQLITSTDFKKPRMEKLEKYWRLYDGDITKKLRQLFKVPIPVFAGMVDTLNAQYDTPVILKFTEGDPSDYFKVQKINAAFQMEVMNTAQNSKWDSKLRMARKHAILNGRAILKYTAESDPEYKSELDIVNLKNFHFQPRGGLYLENHLFAGEEDIQKTKTELIDGAKSGIYDTEQVRMVLSSSSSDYLPPRTIDIGSKLSRFKPLGLSPDDHSFVGETVYKLASWILEIKGERWYLVFHPWSMTWLRFEKWKDICSSDLLPWVSYATHEDDENFLSKSYGDDLYPAADAVLTMFNQELTNREKRNFGPRAYDKDMFKDVRKLDEASHRPDALVPVDTIGGTRRIAEGIYELRTGELNGTINLIDWIEQTLGRSTGANDLSQGAVRGRNLASIIFAEQKSVAKRLSWASQPFQDMMAELGKRYLYGLKDHMPARMAIRLLGERGIEWEQITRIDLNLTKDIDVLIESKDAQEQASELKQQRKKDALVAIGADPLLAQTVNPKWRAAELLKAVGEYEDAEVMEATDLKNVTDKRSLAKASEAIQKILEGKTPELWYAATTAFMQKIVDFAQDNKATLKDKYMKLIDYSSAHFDIVAQNVARQAQQEARLMQGTQPQQPQGAQQPQPQQQPANPGIPGGVSRALEVANSNA